MAKLNLSVAVRPYDRTRALVDGSVQIDGVKPTCMTLSPEEIFFRAFRHAEFDICELSLSSFTVRPRRARALMSACRPSCRAPSATRRFMCAPTASRSRRTSKARNVGVPEYQFTANVWARAILEDDHGVKPSDIHWVRGGIEDADRPEKISIKLPPDVKLENAPKGKSISALLAEGAIDGFMAPRPPSLPRNTPHVGWLFADPVAAAKDYFARTGIFPIMHLVGVRRSLAEQHPWLPGAVFKAFAQSKKVALDLLNDTSATKVTLAVRRGAACRGARTDGRRLLVLRHGGEPQDAGDFPAPPPRPRLVVAAGDGGGDVPPRHARNLQALAAIGKHPCQPSGS